MHKYIEFAKEYVKNFEVEIIEDIISVSKNSCFIFEYKEQLFLFCLDNKFPDSLPKISTTKLNNEYPHFIVGENITGICFGYESDFILYGENPENIIKGSIDNFFRLLNLEKNRQNEEFFKEFLHFWHKNTSKENSINIHFSPSSNAKEIILEIIFGEKIKRRIGRKSTTLAITEDDFINKSHHKNGTKKKAIYIPLKDITYISPFPNLWDIKNLLNSNISEESYKFLKEYKIKKESIVVIFSLFLENKFEIMFASEVFFKNKIHDNSLLSKLLKNVEVKPIYSIRKDLKYLCQRIGVPTKYSNKKIALIGCGSLGSYIANEICKLGINKIDLYDNDFLSTGNIFRHQLGINYCLINKSRGLKIKLENDFPHLNIQYFEENIDWLNFDDKNFLQYDLVIFSIGNTTTQLKVNDLLIEKKFSKPVMYTWLDAYGTGCHAILVDYLKKGCYKCLSLDDNGQFSIHSKISFTENKNDIIYGDGCGGSFSPYGNSILLKGTAMILNIIQLALDGKVYNNNPLFSVKNYKDSNLKYTKLFDKSDDELFERYDYISKGCSCNDK